MRKFNRLGFTAISLVMSLGLVLAGCGGGSNEPAAGSTTAPSASSASSGDAASPTLDPVELNLYFLAPQVKDVKLVEDEINKITKAKFNATVKLNFLFWDSYFDKQKLLIASGDPIDLMFTAGWASYSQYVSQKAFLELDDLLDQYGQGIKDNINPAYLKAPKIDNKLYAIPTQKDMASINGVLMNKELVDKYNFDLSTVKTPADFEPFLKVIKENEPDIIPFLNKNDEGATYWANDFMEPLDTKVPVVVTNRGEPEVMNMFENPKYVELVKLQRDWVQKGYINKDISTLQDSTPLKKAKKAFMWVEQLKPGKAEEMEAQLGYPLVQVDAYADLKPIATTGALNGSMLAIPRSSKNPERAMMFINELFTNKELMNLLAWGIEGKHYKKIGENQIDYADGVDATSSGYTGMAQWAMGGNQFLDYLWASEKPDKWDQFKAFNESAEISPNLGWTFNAEPVKNEIATLKAVVTQYNAAITTGTVDYDTYYPKMKTALERAGLQKVMDEVKKQLEAFKATNQ
ncbi:ABC transporter substrate-binding protein [Cohnella yongneupensis]|uniref:ABC transporter substrate-binding protein n=1 Tax=Cohnella yongneupensis TaxID=425006 RepID=A0ABW0R2J1_9BACL